MDSKAAEQAELRAEIEAQVRQERAESVTAAKLFVRLCKEDDGERLLDAAEWLNLTMDGWPLAMRGVARLGEVSDDIRSAFLTIWIEHKALPRKVGHRPTMAAALRILMRGEYGGGELQVYRGTTRGERRRRLYGFSWTADREIARNFAEGYARMNELSKGFARRYAQVDWKPCVLMTTASAAAVLLKREPEDYYDEAEVVVDPYKLGAVTVLGEADRNLNG